MKPANEVKQEITFTLMTASKPACVSKQFTLADDGTLRKQNGGQLVDGIAERLTLSLSQFRELVPALKPNQALTFGVPEHERARVVTQENLPKQAKGKLPVVARDREHFSWPTGAGAFMVDYDPQPGKKPLSQEQLRTALYTTWPGLEDAPHIWVPTASSCIHRTDTGAELRGLSGQRLYIPIRDASDIPRAGAVLFCRLWLLGHGRYDVSTSGRLLKRTLLDGCVWQPERFDFAAGAVCGPGLEQRRGIPKLFNPEAPFIDSRQLAGLSPEEQSQLDLLLDEARKAKEPEAREQQKRWVNERLAELKGKSGSKSKGKEAELRDLLERAVTQKRLYSDFPLLSEKYGTVTVGQVLNNPDKFHGARFADPLEPEYSGGDHRIAWVNLRTAGRPYLYSHAHWGTRFTLHRAVQVVQIQGGELQELTAKCLELMSLDGTVYAREGELVRLCDGKAFPVSPEWLAWYLTGLLQFQKWDKRSEEWKIIDCPLTLARTLCAMTGQWSLPTLEGVLTAPSMTPEGRLIQEDGFDVHCGLYLHFPKNESWPTIPEHPDPQTVKTALAFLWRAFERFPFVSPVDRGGFLALLLTALVRPLLPTAPGYLISAPVAGSGKTLLALCVAALAGVIVGVSSAGRDEEELEKRLLTELRYFSRCIILDNLARPLESESLCAYLSTPYYAGRLLGSNLQIAGRPVSAVIITGNNPTIIGDLNRRLLRVTIDPACEKPFDRRFDLDPLAYVHEHRLSMVRAGLVILKAALASGFKHDGGRLASFEVWSDFIRNAVLWVGKNRWLEVADPATSIDLSFAVDPETNRLKALQNEWKRVFGERGGTVADAIRRATDREKPDLAFFDILNEVAGEKGRFPPGVWETGLRGTKAGLLMEAVLVDAEPTRARFCG